MPEEIGHQYFISQDHLSILLDTISFFLITTDLYGTERLNKMRTYFETVNPVFSLRIFVKNYFKRILKWIMIGLMPFALWDIYLILTQQFNWPYQIILIFVIMPVAITFFFVLLTLPNLILFPVLKFVFRLFPVEGTMITLGAIIFLLNKLIIWFDWLK